MHLGGSLNVAMSTNIAINLSGFVIFLNITLQRRAGKGLIMKSDNYQLGCLIILLATAVITLNLKLNITHLVN